MANPYPINPLLEAVVKIWMTVFTWYYRISPNISKETRNIDEPYLLLSNHYGRYDPFIISNFIRKRPNFISSDAILRDKVIGTLFKGLGAMPKKKGVRDSHIIREMVKVIRSGGALALFPEGTRTWTGETLYMDPSIAKLIKLLNVPVITSRMKGAYAFDPRWAKRIRRAKVEIDYEITFTKEDIKAYSEEQIMEELLAALYQDDMVYQRQQKIVIQNSKRAEHLDLILFQCPACEQFAGFHSSGNSVACKACDLEVKVDKYGFFKAKEEVQQLPFDNPKDWLNWQNKNFACYLAKQLELNQDEPLFKAEDLKIEYAIGNGRMMPQGIGDIFFYADGLLVKYADKEEKLLYTDMASFGPQFNERLEMFYKDRAYRFTATKARVPGVKWELAANVVWYKIGEQHKLSPYFRELVATACENKAG